MQGGGEAPPAAPLPPPCPPRPPPRPPSPSLAHCVSVACSEVRRTLCLGGKLRRQEVNALWPGAPWGRGHYHVPIKVRTPALRKGSDILGPALLRGQWRAQIWPLFPPQGWLLGSGMGPSFPRRMGGSHCPRAPPSPPRLLSPFWDFCLGSGCAPFPAPDLPPLSSSVNPSCGGLDGKAWCPA